MGAAAPRTQITCKALECKCTAEHSLNIGSTVYCNWTIVLKPIAIFGNCFQNNSYNSFLYNTSLSLVYKFSIIRLFFKSILYLKVTNVSGY